MAQYLIRFEMKKHYSHNITFDIYLTNVGKNHQ